MSRTNIFALLTFLVASGCVSPAEAPAPATPSWASRKSVEAVAPHLHGWPPVASRTVLAVTGGGSLTGTVALTSISSPFFRDNAAPFRLLDMPSAHALIALTTLDGRLLSSGGMLLETTSGQDGRFVFSGTVPTDRPFVVNALLANNHGLSAIVTPGTESVVVTETSSMVTEMLRHQLPTEPTPGGRSLADLTAHQLKALMQDSASAASVSLEPVGEPPSVEALKVGMGARLRNLYVAAFGIGVAPDGDTAPNRLSDTWRALLGFRPLAVTRFAGLGSRSYDDGVMPSEAGLIGPTDAVADAAGSVVIAEQDAGLLRFIPAVDMPEGFLGHIGAMAAGRIYTIAGVLNGPSTLTEFDAFYKPIEAASAIDPSAAPLLSGGFPVYTPYRVALVSDDSGPPHLFFTSKFGHRVFLIPGSNITGRYGRNFRAGRLYTLAGQGAQRSGAQLESDDPATPNFDEERADYLYGEGGPAHQAGLSQPTGLAVDGDGNVFFLDAGYVENELKDAIASGETDATYTFPNENAPPGRSIVVYHGTIRAVRAIDGKIVTLRLTYGGQPFPIHNAEDFRLSRGYLYVADTAKHWVFRVPVPADLTALPPSIEIEPVVGVPGQPGYLAPGAPLPDLYHAFDGVPLTDARLNGPMSLAFGPGGEMVIADAGSQRLRLLANNLVYTIAGGLDTHDLEGDAHLAYFPLTGAVRFDHQGNMLVVDRKENIVRRVWTARGVL